MSAHAGDPGSDPRDLLAAYLAGEVTDEVAVHDALRVLAEAAPNALTDLRATATGSDPASISLEDDFVAEDPDLAQWLAFAETVAEAQVPSARVGLAGTVWRIVDAIGRPLRALASGDAPIAVGAWSLRLVPGQFSYAETPEGVLLEASLPDLASPISVALEPTYEAVNHRWVWRTKVAVSEAQPAPSMVIGVGNADHTTTGFRVITPGSPVIFDLRPQPDPYWLHVKWLDRGGGWQVAALELPLVALPTDGEE